MQNKCNISILWAILAALLYAISSPISKILLNEVPPTLMASLLYFGAGIGMSLIGYYRYKTSKSKVEGSLTKKEERLTKQEKRLTKKELPFTVAMVILDIAAPIFLMIGLTITTAENASLLNNFEIVATSLIALIIFKETISRRLWLGIGLITIASIILSVSDISSLSFSFGSIFVLLASICWGFENNCTRMLSVKDPLQIVIIKGFGSGLGSLLISLILKETSNNLFQYWENIYG